MWNSSMVAGLAFIALSISAPRVKADVTVSMNVPSVTASMATISITGLFLGGSGDAIQSIQLSVQGSDDALTDLGTDFSRFQFTNVLPDFSATDFDASTGILLLFADEPVDGPFLVPSLTEYALWGR